MEINNENKHLEYLKSKIHLHEKSVTKGSRPPLKPLKDLDSNVAFKDVNLQRERVLRKSNSFCNADTRFVTIPRSDTNCGFSVFNDDNENCTNRKRPTPGPKKCFLKNVKTSLKRPHTRDLQSVASVTKSLSFTEEISINKRLLDNSTVDTRKFSYDSTCNRVYGMDIFTYLLENEVMTPDPTFLHKIKNRAFALNWITDINSTGDPSIIQTAAWYFDMVLSIRSIKMEDVPVAITACFWISRKIHGNVCTARALVEKSGRVFDMKRLCTTERKFLNLLKTPRQPVVPQEFIVFLAWWCNREMPEQIMTSASFICLSAISLNLEMVNEYPSVIAAAAIRNALLLLKKQHLVEKLKGCFVYQAALMKSDIIEVCIKQIGALKMIFSYDFEFKAPKKLFKNDLGTFDKLKNELDYLYQTGGEGIIRAFLMY